jgi:hypothetical protein
MDSVSAAIHELRFVHTRRFLEILAEVLKASGGPLELLTAVEVKARNFHPAEAREWRSIRSEMAVS